MNKGIIYLAITTTLFLVGCCTDSVSLAPTLTQKPAVTGNKPEWSAGMQIDIKLTQCASDIFLVAWNALKTEKNELNQQLLAGKISKEIYDASIAKIDEERKLVLSKLGGETKGISIMTPTESRDVIEARVASHILDTIANIKSLKSGKSGEGLLDK